MAQTAAGQKVAVDNKQTSELRLTFALPQGEAVTPKPILRERFSAAVMGRGALRDAPAVCVVPIQCRVCTMGSCRTRGRRLNASKVERAAPTRLQTGFRRRAPGRRLAEARNHQ